MIYYAVAVVIVAAFYFAAYVWIPRRERIAKALDEVLLSADIVADELAVWTMIANRSDAYTQMTRMIAVHSIEELACDLLQLKAARGYTYRKEVDHA